MVETGKLSPEARASAEEGALLNATRHGGKAEVGAVLGRILGEFPSLRGDSPAVAKEVANLVKSINAMSPEEQETLLRERYPEAGSTEQKQGRVGLPPLRNAVKGKTGFRLPPEPSGFMTVGHAMAFTINYLYKETYQGELWLRFEDTNPRKVAPQYYESFRRGIDWLSIRCDHEKNVSDDIPLIYSYGKKLVQQGDAYACGCDEAKVKRLRFDGVPCEHRDNSEERNLEVWDGLVGGKYKEGEWVIRIRGDMSSQNFSLRDSNLFRVIDKPHPLVGSKYSLWPTYDIANAVEDEVCMVTHVLRSSEFRNELQQVIREKLGFRPIEVIQFSRFNFKGTPVSKRLLRPLVEQKFVTGWDDPRMPTVDGMRRRGIIPQAIRDFTLQVGYTKTEHEYDWSLLLAVNRKLLDPDTKRLFFVPDPIKVEVSGAEPREVELRFHPQSNLGTRKVSTGDKFYLPAADLKSVKQGEVVRLMDLYNLRMKGLGQSPTAEYAGDELMPGTKKLQWTAESGTKTKVLVPGPLFLDDGSTNPDSMKVVNGLGEEALLSLQMGEIVQFPRFGFCRLDSPGVFVMAS